MPTAFSLMTSSVPRRAPALAPDLHLGEPITDTMHEEFVQLLNAAASAPDDALAAALDAWIAHTREHFAQEEAWMEAMDFGPRHCHAGQHRQVLDVAAEVRRQVADEHRFAAGRQLVSEVREWFAWHVSAMDSMMVESLRESGMVQAV
ncbi:hemerythrin-like metal-binding protein [Paraburkholderia unamae]|nr:hemerythrin-like metal-binding protein [Paraburkholderia unamae]